MTLHVETYIEGATPVHACDARCKIVLLVAYSIVIFFVETWPGMAVCALVVAAALACANIGVGRVCKLLVPVFILAAFTIVFNAIPWSLEGFERGVFFGCRMVLLVAASYVVCLTTTATALVDAFRSLASPLRAIKVPVDDIALVLSLSVRFIPLTFEELQATRAAQACRGARFSTGSLVQRAQAAAGLFVPMFAGMFRRADALATSMDARCYGAARPTHLPLEEHVAPSVGAAVALGAVLVICAVFL